jgi:predicted transcriptional regulator
MGIREVAKMASVSTATVSRLLTGAAKVSPETARRIIDAMQALNFQPNESARILAVLKKFKRSAGESLVWPEGVVKEMRIDLRNDKRS